MLMRPTKPQLGKWEEIIADTVDLFMRMKAISDETP